jgi:sialidase-1
LLCMRPSCTSGDNVVMIADSYAFLLTFKMHLLATKLAAFAALLSSASALPSLTDVFVAKSGGYACYRIPSLLVLPSGALIAISEGRLYGCADHGYVDLVSKMSSNGGKTWGPLKKIYGESSLRQNVTIGNPCPVFDSLSDKLLLPFSRNNLEAGLLVSSDMGNTWAISSPLPVPADWTWVATGPPGGIQLQGGRIIVPSDHATSAGTFSHAYVSDDGGATWNISSSVAHGNECQAAAMPWVSPTTVLLNMRTVLPARQVAVSTDGGSQWGAVTPTITETQCEGSTVSLPSYRNGPLLAMSSAYASTRSNMTLHTSANNGAQWVPAALVYPGASAYSSLAVLSDGQTSSNLGLLFERDDYAAIAFATITL